MSKDLTSKGIWELTFESYDAETEGGREALLALGNGYLGTRAAAPEAVADGIHYPGTHRAGLYNRLVSRVNGEEVEDTSLVNLPNWLPVSFRIDGGEPLSLDQTEVLEYHQTLELKRGLLRRDIRFRDAQGRCTTLREKRFVSMAQPHLMALRVELVAEDWSGQLDVQVALDGRVVNDNVARHASYAKRHLEPLGTGALEPHGLWLKARTVQSRVEVALAARTQLWLNGYELRVDRQVSNNADYVAEGVSFTVREGMSVVLEKVAALYTSQDLAISESAEAARDAVVRAPRFSNLLGAHERAWEALWSRCELDMESPERLLAARLHAFQVLQSYSPHCADLDVGIPARGLSGEAYRGHIFWDELFVMPFLTYRFPATARSALLYRYRRLDEARARAVEAGFKGAMFPWRSASGGREETPSFQLNPLSGLWWRDHTDLQRHIGAAVAYNAWRYIEVTGDSDFLHDYSAELILEVARFFASLAVFNPDRDRFEIRRVVGPDEYHTAYPDAAAPGIDNNTYTNVMAVWVIAKALEILGNLPAGHSAALRQRLKVTGEELEFWEQVSRRMYVAFRSDGLPDQFEGFERLEPIDLHAFREQHENEHVDLVLRAKGESPDAYRVAKQADTAMLLYLLTIPELTELLGHLGYPLEPTNMKQMLNTHLGTTVHESSLSRVVYAGALAQLDPETSWQLFEEARRTVTGAEGEAEGIHLGAAAGMLQVVQSRFLGLHVRKDVLCFDPTVPRKLEFLTLSISFRGSELTIQATDTRLEVSSGPGGKTVSLFCRGKEHELIPGTLVKFDL